MSSTKNIQSLWKELCQVLVTVNTSKNKISVRLFGDISRTTFRTSLDQVKISRTLFSLEAEMFITTDS